MRIDNGRYREVVMNWSNITPPLKAGTPIAADGTVSNDGNAIGIVPVAVIAQTVMPRSIFILDAGDVNLEEVEAESGLTIAAGAKAAMAAIRFHKSDGTIDNSGDYTLPAATEEEIGGVMQAENLAESEASTVELLTADFNALLDALKTAGIMAPDPEPEESDESET